MYLLSPQDRVKKMWKGPTFSNMAFNSILLTLQYLQNMIWMMMQNRKKRNLLWGIGDVLKYNPRIIQFIRNWTISILLLYASLACAEVDVAINLLLLDVRETREDVAVTLSVSVIDVPDPLINIVQRSQCLVSLNRHTVLCSGIQMWMRFRIPKVIWQNTDRNFT